MDDLEHSVQIAEREWESFYEESDECFVQQVSLAGSDDLGFSDTDEEGSSEESVLPHQAISKEGAEGHSDGAGTSWMEPERLMENVDRVPCAEANPTKCERSADLEAVPIGRRDEDSGTENSGPAVEEPTSFISVQDAGNVGSSAGGTVPKDSESSTSKKEKERWFVTVNESPAKLRGSKSGQKKAKQKKKFKMMTDQNTAAGGEAEKGEHQKEQPFQRGPEWRHHTEEHLRHGNETSEQNVSTLELQTDSGLASSCLRDPKDKFRTDDPAHRPSASSLASVSSIVKDDHPTEGHECKLKNPTDHFITDGLVGGDDATNDESALNAKSWKPTGPLNFPKSKDPSDQPTRNVPSPQEIQNESLEAAIGPACPVYALSAFWNEIEKLTINDILHLRTISNPSPTHSQRNGVLESEHNRAQSVLTDDSDECADSDYFTQVHDVDRLSWEFSSLSDFDGMETPRGSPNPEFPKLQLPNPELANLQYTNLQIPKPEFPNPKLANHQLPNLQIPNQELSNLQIPNPKLLNLQIPNPELPHLQIPNLELFNTKLPNLQITNPELSNPELLNLQHPNLQIPNPELLNLQITNPKLPNPKLTNHPHPNLQIPNPELLNLQISNPELPNPKLTNHQHPNLQIPNPELLNLQISNPELPNLKLTNHPHPNLQIPNFELLNPKLLNLQIPNPEHPNLELLHSNLELLNPEIPNPMLPNPQLPNPKLPNPKIANHQLPKLQIPNPEHPNPEQPNIELLSPNLQIPNPEIPNPELPDLQLPNPPNPEHSNLERLSLKLPKLQIPNPELSNPELAVPQIPKPEHANLKLLHPKLPNSELPNPLRSNPKLPNLQHPNSELPNPEQLKFEKHASEQQPEQIRVNSELEMVDPLRKCLQDEVPLLLYPEKEVHNVFFTLNETDDRNTFELEHIRTPSPVLPSADLLDGQRALMFSDILAKDIDAEGHPACFPDSQLCCSLVSFPYSQKPCVSETYDDFFSDDLFLPEIQDETVPIFSTSSSAVRDLMFPLVNEFIELNIEDDHFPVKVISRFSIPPEHSTGIAMQNLYPANQNRDWKRCLSLRKFGFVGRGGTWYQKISSWIFPKDAKKVKTYDFGVRRMVPMMHEDHEEVIRLIHQMDHHALLISKREDFLSSIQQADMCLVCIAFASWVLTSSNPESTDTWKAALLANISAISAIQYIRKYLKKEGSDP